MTDLPADLAANPRLGHWITVHGDGTVDVRCGKVELGQGILTALAQIAAEELDVALSRIRMIAMTTGTSPDEQLTAGSRSIEDSGPAIRQAAAEVRALMLAAAALELNVGTDRLSVDDGTITDGTGTATYWDLAATIDLDVGATGAARPRRTARVVGTSAPRLDLPDKVLGRPRFIHDLTLPGQLYGRVVRPPTQGATLRELDTTGAKALAGVVEIVRDGSFVGVVAAQEETALTAAALLREGARWDDHHELPDDLPGFLQRTPAERTTIDERPPPAEPPEQAFTATYTRPYLAHASIAPSCGIARWTGAAVEIWSHSQGVYNLRKAVCLALRLEPGQVTVHHAESAGCYGHNGADDAAFDAVLLARAVPGRPVQVVWSRSDELSWAPFGPAMAVRLTAGLTGAGEVLTWRHETFGNGHVTRPGSTKDVAPLLGAAHRAGGTPIPVAGDPPPARGGGGDRNSVPCYTFPAHQVIRHRLLEMPLRTSALRSLGAYANVFAIESFLDELAVRAGANPVEFRLRYTTDERARAVIRTAADKAGWARQGQGFAFARYSNHGAYCAVVAEVEAETEVQVRRLTIAVDAGLVVNPDGLRNQVEGGAIQSTSWTVKEQVRFDRTRVTSDDWESYPILRFSEVPAVDITLLDRPDLPSLGAGETAQGPVAAAIANALYDAIGVRVRNLPLSPENIVAAME